MPMCRSATEQSDGKRVRAFEMLSLHRQQIANEKLSMDKKDGSPARTVNLKRQAAMRQTQAAAALEQATLGIPIS